MPVRKNVVFENLPPELAALYPEQDTADVMIGRDCYVLAPLPAGRVEAMATELVNLVADIFGDVVLRAERNEALNYAMLADAFQKGLKKAVSSGAIVRMVATALDLDEATVRDNATLKQLFYVAGLLWKQNFDVSALSEEARKNVSSLLVTLGIKRQQNDTVYQWADYAIRTLSSQHAGSPEERIAMVLKIADEMQLIEKNTPTGTTTPTSPSTAASAGSTSSDIAKSAAS